MAKSPEEYAHLEWLGYVQPVGLVVSIPAMLDAQCYINKNIAADHRQFLDCLPKDGQGELVAEVADFPAFLQRVFGWEAEDLVSIDPVFDGNGPHRQLEVFLPQYNETLRPTHVVKEFIKDESEEPTWLMLVQELPPTVDFDEAAEDDSARHWSAPPQAKFERLLRETGVPIGLLSNRRQLRCEWYSKSTARGAEKVQR